MKIIVKTLNGKQLPLEIEATWTIRQVKEQIEKEHALAADTLKLIAYGKVLDSDEKAASEYALKEGDFVVAMQQKAKPAPKKKEDAKQEEPVAAATNSQPAATTAPVQAQPSPAVQAQPASSMP